MMFLIVILFYIKTIFMKLYKKNFLIMSINSSNTLYNTKYNYTLLGYDNRYPIYEKNKALLNNINKYNMKKHILDVLENKDISVNDKFELLQKYGVLNESKSIKTVDLKAGNLMKHYDYEYKFGYDYDFDYDFDYGNF